MKQRGALFLALILGLALAACATPPPSFEGGSTYVFDDVSVIAMEDDSVVPGQRVVVSDGAIAQIGPIDTVEVPEGAELIDGRGKFLLPGFSDLHVHFPTANARRAFGGTVADPRELMQDEFLFLFLANGVTRIQVMSGDTEALAIRDQIAAGERLGPKMIVNTPMIDGDPPVWPRGYNRPVRTAEEAEQAVRELHAAGYDRVKVYHLIPDEAYRGLIATAHELDMPVDGHSPISVGGIPGALAAGQRLIAHSYDFIARTPPGERNRATMDRLADLWRRYPDTWHTPTLTTSKHTIYRTENLDAVLSQPRYRYVHPETVKDYRETARTNPAAGESRGELVARLREQYDLQAYAVSRLRENGIVLMTATDVSFPPIVAGFSLHDELRLMVEDAGLSPYQALSGSTRLPAEYHREGEGSGTIAVDQRADLVLLDRNPLVDIGASKSIAGVMVSGQWLSAETIRERLADIASYFERHRATLERNEMPEEPPPSSAW